MPSLLVAKGRSESAVDEPGLLGGSSFLVEQAQGRQGLLEGLVPFTELLPVHGSPRYSWHMPRRDYGANVQLVNK